MAAGIGDDCALLRVPHNQELLVTTDFSLEGIHFRRDWHPPESAGHRCLARGLSDIAAMGGKPVAAFLSLALPDRLPQKWVDRFLNGLFKLAARSGISLAGGDTSRSPKGVLADIIVVGSVPRGEALLRSGARPGDRLYVTGSLGGSAIALRLLQSGKKLRPAAFPRHFFPEPKIEIGHFLCGHRIASAAIDVSDGLSTDLAHICEESGTGAEVFEEAIPLAQTANASARERMESALHGGEDYELLFTARRSTSVPRRIAGISITEIGVITRTRGLVLNRAGGKRTALKAQGWEYFRRD